MASSAHGEFGDLVGSVDQLIAIHSKLQQGRGRRHEQDAIHRAGVVMTIAAWESYIEKVVMEALGAIENAAGVAAAAAPVPVPAWARHAFVLRRTEISKNVRRFNTPDATNVRDLLVESLEFNPWASWEWHIGPRQWDEREMRSRLNDWVRVRHSVAHGFALPNDVAWLQDAGGRPRLTLTLLRECKKFFEHLTAQTDGGLATHLCAQHGIPRPW